MNNDDNHTDAYSWDLRCPGSDLSLRVWIGECKSQSASVSSERDCVRYSVDYMGRQVILPSRFGLGLAGEPPLVNGFSVQDATISEVRENFIPLHGEQSTACPDAIELLLQLRETLPPQRRLNMRLRCYSDAVAFRYEIPQQPGITSVEIQAEQTTFTLPSGALVWETLHAQGRYQRVAPIEMGGCVERPLTVEYPDGSLCASILEADIYDRPKGKLGTRFGFDRLTIRIPQPGTILVQLDGPAGGPLPYATAWRVIQFAPTHAGLIGRSDLLQSLCPPTTIDNTDWITPGKCLRVMHLCTTAGLAAIDFACANNLRYIEFDAGWYGHEFNDAEDPTFVSLDPRRRAVLPAGRDQHPVTAGADPDLDLAKVIATARERGIGVFLYVNRRHLERHLETLLPIFRDWGIAGIKFGFVQEGSREWSRWLHNAIRRCADFGLLVDVHDEYRPTGLSRTLPNLLTQEGICGNEEMPDATHNVTLPFTRFLAGAADYTICHRFENMEQRLKTTPAHQLAMAAVYFSPLQFLFWYGHPHENNGLPELEWYRNVPTVWDETRGLCGEIGSYVATARRSGDNWFLGVMTNNDARDLELPLDFLAPGKSYQARILADSSDASPGQPTDIVMTTLTVTAATRLSASLRPSGGMAVQFTLQSG